MSRRATKIKGKAWVIRDASGKAIDDIDTDQIFHNAHLAVTDIKEMGRFAFGNLKGWEDFPAKVSPGDIVVVGKNFGAGSSRQQAVDCFASLGVSLLIAESFGAIYKRNAVNSGFPILLCENIMGEKDGEGNFVETGDLIEADLLTGEVKNITKENVLIKGLPLSRVQLDIYQAGNLFNYGRK